MNKREQHGYINLDGAFTALIVVGAIGGALFATIAWVVVPWLWTWLKPLIHGWTA